MSNPTTNGEIEDVLSSIRRLVSEDDSVTSQNGSEGDKGPDRLVLTAALRVDDKDDKGQDDTPVQAEEAADQPDAGDDKPSLESTVANLEAAVDQTASQWDEDDAPAAAQSGEWEITGEADRSAEISDTAEDAELVEATPEDEAPAGVVMFASSGARSSHDDTAMSVDETENVSAPDLEALLDEEELRALVAEVLREELKGPLGERITRNVRKLVRREIAQALSTLDTE